MTLNKFITTLLLVLITNSLFAQGPIMRNRIKTLKVAYITEQLGLTSNEAQEFWPVYNQHHQKMEKLRSKEREQFEGVQTDMSIVSDKDAESLVTNYLLMQEEKSEIDKKFITDLRQVISAKKIILLFRAEKNFKKRLLQQYRNKRGQR